MSSETEPSPADSPSALLASQQTTFSAGGSRQIPRPVRACDRCRQSKVKCDQQRPCTNCISKRSSCTSRLAWKKRGPTQTSYTVPPFSIIPSGRSNVNLRSPSSIFNLFATPEPALHSPTVQASLNWASDEHNVHEHESDFASLQNAGAVAVIGNHQPSVTDNMVDNCSMLDSPDMSRSPNPNPHHIAANVPTTDYPVAVRSEEFWPACFTEEMIMPWVDIFFDRLYPTLPLLDRTSLYRDMICRRHRKDRQYGAMVLALCAFSLIQPIHTQERQSMPMNDEYARVLLDEAFRLHSRSDLGENPVLETVLTSFFMFGCLFGLQKHNAAWLKLREAIDVATILCIQLPEAYTYLNVTERMRRVRIFFVLSVTERAYALQRHHEIEFKGRPGYIMRCLTLDTVNGMSNIGPPSGIDAKAMAGLSRMMELLDTVDESFVHCWNGQCGGTSHFDTTDALLLQKKLLATSFSNTDQVFSGMTDSQEVDIRILGHWLMNRLWNMCLSHGLLCDSTDEPLLCYQYGSTLAQEIVQICKRYSTNSIDVHGLGIIERLYDIAAGAVSSLALMAQLPGHSEVGSEDAALSQDIAPVESNRTTLQDISDLLASLRSGEHPYMNRLKTLIGEYSPYPYSAQ